MSTDFVYVNNGNTTLANPITTTGQTTITLTSTANLPTLSAGQIMALTLTDAAGAGVFEIVYVTAIAGANLTVVRGQEGTVANTWLAGDFAYVSETAAILNSFVAINTPAVQDVNITGQIAVTPANSSTIGTVVNAASGQTAQLSQWNGLSGGLAAVTNEGNFISTFGNGVANSYLPPYVTPGGAQAPNTLHGIDPFSESFSGVSSITVTLTGAGPYTSSTSYTVTVNSLGNNPMSVKNISGTQFQVYTNSGGSVTDTVVLSCIGH
jgi:hypothetical protein